MTEKKLGLVSMRNNIHLPRIPSPPDSPLFGGCQDKSKKKSSGQYIFGSKQNGAPPSRPERVLTSGLPHIECSDKKFFLYFLKKIILRNIHFIFNKQRKKVFAVYCNKKAYKKYRTLDGSLARAYSSGTIKLRHLVTIPFSGIYLLYNYANSVNTVFYFSVKNGNFLQTI